MADDRFSLTSIRQQVSGRVANLLGPSEQPNAKSFDGTIGMANQPFMVEQEDFDRTEAPKDEMREYWRQYETTPMVRKPISSFASQVIEPGYYVDAPHLSEEDTDRLQRWLETCAILEGELGKDWRNMAKKAVIQREVRGTVMIEKVPAEGDSDKLAGFKFINPETMETITRPNQTILLAPEDIDVYEDAPKTDDGEAAAYLQDISETGQTMWGTPIDDRYRGEHKITFTRDEIIKFTRDADVGEVFGTSRLEAVADRVNGLKQKLSDNDEAIASKAYPLMLFLFGSVDAPWSRDDISSFMSAHEMKNFHPGMKQGVRGDVTVETIAGEVADIAEYLQFDVDYIISAMPMPKYALGGFSESVGQIAGVTQQQDIQRQINEARRELETEFTPSIQQKASELGLSDPERVRLKIGSPDRPEQQPNVNQNIIRYFGVGNEEEDPLSDAPESPENGSQNDAVSDTSDMSEPNREQAEAIWEQSLDLAELQVEDDSQLAIAECVYDGFTRARDLGLQAIDDIVMDMDSRRVHSFSEDANNAIDRAMREARVKPKSMDVIREEVLSIQDEYREGLNSSFTMAQNASYYANNVEMAARGALDQMMREMRLQIRRSLESDEMYETARARFEQRYDDTSLRARAEMVAHMELTRARESTKLQEFERHSDIVGVRVVGDGASTAVCQMLDAKEAYFDDGGITEQLSEYVREDLMHVGFKPLPATPPYHFNCNTQLEPIYR